MITDLENDTMLFDTNLALHLFHLTLSVVLTEKARCNISHSFLVLDFTPLPLQCGSCNVKQKHLHIHIASFVRYVKSFEITKKLPIAHLAIK